VVFALAVIFLLALNPVSLLLHSDQPNSASGVAVNNPQATQDPCSGQCYLSGGASLASIFPFATDRETPQRTDEEIVELDDERADVLFDVLSSATARDILQELLMEPQTPSELAEEIDTSLQNIHYHVENLDEAGAIEETTIEYSSRGREMSVYTATVRPQMLLYDIE
jgi:DNA-binding transcriptional ArsR family regulator